MLSDALTASSQPDDPTAGMSAVDLLKLRWQLAGTQQVSPEQRAANLKQTGWEALSVIPGPANMIAAKDAWDSGKEAVREFGQGNLGRGALATALAGLSGFGAVTGLPTSKMAGQVAKDAGLTTRIFAGPMAKTADHAALARAQDMKDAGASRDDIWRDTGWDINNRDGVPRFEIDDSGAKLAGQDYIGGGITTFNGLEHPGLSAAYGEPPSVYGHIEPGKRVQGYYRHDGSPQVEAYSPDVENAKSVTLHEFQHDAQAKEGFSPGSTTAQFETRDEVIAALERAKANGGLDPVTGDFDIAIESRLRNAVDDPYDAYRRTSGEVEARNVQARMNMSPAERRAKAPWLTQDVPDEQQIVRSGR